MTMSDGLLHNATLRKCWTMCGTKHRFIQDEPMTDLLRDTMRMKAHAQSGVSKCKRIMSENTTNHRGYEQWASSVTADICRHINNIPNGTDPGKCLPVAHRQNIPELDQTAMKRLRKLQSDFCIYTVDKNSGAFSLICLRGYLEGCSASLDSQAYELQDASAEDIIHDNQEKVQERFNITPHPTMSIYSELPKLHKAVQPAMRPLVNSHATTNTKLSLNLTIALKAMRLELDLIYNTAYATSGLGENPSERSWWIADSVEGCQVLQKYNTCDRNEERWKDLPRHPYMQTGDFEQLYTSLPHNDLLARTQSVIQEAFTVRKPAPQGKVVVLKFNNGIAKWQSITADTARTRKGKEFFTLDMMMEAVDRCHS